MMKLSERSSGVLLHLTSLPHGHGIGDLGPASYSFVDFLRSAGCRWWQTLPVVPPAEGNSPYKALSAFAGNPLLISLDRLADIGLLDRSDLPLRPSAAGRVRFSEVTRLKGAMLRRAFESFRAAADHRAVQKLETFRNQERDWLDDYALFMALRDANAEASWCEWHRPIRIREPADLKIARDRYRTEIDYHCFVQHIFDMQWRDLRAYGARAGVGLIGDMPIFVAHDSADVWTNQSLFALDRSGRPTMMAGSPPDYFSKTGQIWGNPHYRWDALHNDGYRWWLARLRKAFERSDAVRLDHFIGFERYWAIPAGARTARAGRWLHGPSGHFFDAVRTELGELQLIAEDLGAVTPEVRALRDRFELPGMRVLQFGFDGDEGGREHQPHNYSRNSVAYTGTHDNDTTVGWFRGSAGMGENREQILGRRRRVLAYAGTTARDIHWVMIRLVLGSVAQTAVIPMQDLLGLGSSARMNWPGTADGNWRWRLRPGAASDSLARRLREMNQTYGRLAPDSRHANLSRPAPL